MSFLGAVPAAPTDPPGVGPHPEPWPDDPRLDPELLAEGDRRNVVDRYRYWRLEEIVAEHGGVLSALRQGDAALAEKLMREHLDGARDALASQFPAS